MTNGGVYISKPDILDEIRYHRFGALVEVTFGVTDPIRRNRKRRQIQVGTRLIEKAVGDSAYILPGIAFTQNTQSKIPEVKFSLEVNQLDPDRLEYTARTALRSDHLSSQSKEDLERMLHLAATRSPDYLSDVLNAVYARRLSPDLKAQFMNSIAEMKGVIFELYIVDLFEKSLSIDSSLRARLDAHGSASNKENTKMHTEIDLLIATSPNDFESSLENINGEWGVRVYYSR